MPVKIARSTPRPSFGLRELLVASHISRLASRDAAKSLLSTLVSESSGECRFKPDMRTCRVKSGSPDNQPEAKMAKVINLLKRFRFLQLSADALFASSKILRSPYLSGKFFPYKPDQDYYVLLKSSDQGQEYSGFPIPPEHLQTWGEGTESYLNSGKEHVNTMKHILSQSGFLIQPSHRILDFGCGAGRVIRWLGDSVEGCEVWGVDIQSDRIMWCQQHLSPPFKFATVTTAPHLPFEDRYFDLIYCGSVFTHIDDLADAWLLELKRILQPGGRLYITVHEKHSLQKYLTLREQDWDAVGPLRLYDKKIMISQLDFNVFTMGRGYVSQVFYDIDYLQRHWGCILDVISVTQDAWGNQTVILLKK